MTPAPFRLTYGMDEATSERFLDCGRLLGHLLRVTRDQILGEDFGPPLLSLLQHAVEELRCCRMRDDARLVSSHDVMVMVLHIMAVMLRHIPSLGLEVEGTGRNNHRGSGSGGRGGGHGGSSSSSSGGGSRLASTTAVAVKSSGNNGSNTNSNDTTSSSKNTTTTTTSSSSNNNNNISNSDSSTAPPFPARFLSLVQQAVRLEPRGESGFTLLHMACSYHTSKDRFRLGDLFFPSFPLVHLLLRVGARAGARAEKGVTPLHVITRPPNIPFHNGIVRELLARGAHVDARDEEGVTPLNTLTGLRGPLEHLGRMLCPVGDTCLQCLAARCVVSHGVPYRGHVSPYLEEFVALH